MNTCGLPGRPSEPESHCPNSQGNEDQGEPVSYMVSYIANVVDGRMREAVNDLEGWTIYQSKKSK